MYICIYVYIYIVPKSHIMEIIIINKQINNKFRK